MGNTAPPTADPAYLLRSPQLFPPPAWAVRPGEPEVHCGPPWSFIDAFINGSHLVQQVPQEHDYSDPESQVNQVTAATMDHRTAALSREEAVRWELRGAGPVPGPPQRGAGQRAASAPAPDPWK
jgi:hypothetical protein